MIMPGSQLLWQMSRMLHLFMFPAPRLSQLPLPWFNADSSEPSQHKQSISWPSARLPSKTTLRLGSPCPWVKKQTKPGKPNQNNSFFFVLEDTREEFTRTSECEPQNSLISGWLPFPTPLCPVNTNQHCRASARSPTFPKIHPSSNCVEGMAPSKVRIWLTVLEESYNYMPVTTTFPSRWVPKCHLPKATEKRHLEV